MDYIAQLVERYPEVEENEKYIRSACDKIIECYKCDGKLLVCGNGGSCADAEHIVGELTKGFLKRRMLSELNKMEIKARCTILDDAQLDEMQYGLPAMSLNSGVALATSFYNEHKPDLVYAQQVMTFGKRNDIFIGLSAFGNEKSVYFAADMANVCGMSTIALTGKDGGILAKLCDVSIIVPESEAFKIQELHIAIYHAICATVEDCFFCI